MNIFLIIHAMNKKARNPFVKFAKKGLGGVIPIPKVDFDALREGSTYFVKMTGSDELYAINRVL